MHEALRRDVTVDAVQRVGDLEVEARPEGGALAVIARPVERRLAQRLQAAGDRRRAVDRIASLGAIEGIGRGEQRLLLAGDEVVDQAFDAVVVDRRERHGGLFAEPLGDLEAGAHARQCYARRAATPIMGIDSARYWANRVSREGANAHSARRGERLSTADWGQLSGRTAQWALARAIAWGNAARRGGQCP